MGVNVDRASLAIIKRYNFDSRGIAFEPENYYAWRRPARGKGMIDDLRYIVHELTEVRELQQMQQHTGFDFMGHGNMTKEEGKQWNADFNENYYLYAHSKALEAEYQFLAHEIGRVTRWQDTFSKEVIAACDSTRPEGRERMLIGKVFLEKHSRFQEWQSKGDKVLYSLSKQTRIELGLPEKGTVTLKRLIEAIKLSRPVSNQ
ncbi:hypothetical protein [Anthocerotibacter panamensis]|uniref:hypothetical protein n=1 Tax=Anthocerotibacter panamensis TaxID=2857077 RepID=UPI001C407401|nr:hypothetical protein [Anthocerotibacter panamensis]